MSLKGAGETLAHNTLETLPDTVGALMQSWQSICDYFSSHVQHTQSNQEFAIIFYVVP